jgi:hypothetical protein
MSNILEMYDAVKTVTVSPVTRVKDLHELPANPASSEMPMRLLLPFGAGDNEGNMAEYMDRYSNAFVSWTLVDLCLMRPAAEGEGIHTIAEDVVRYAGAYISAFVLNRYLSDTYHLEVMGVTAKPGIIEYPSQSGKYYHGCLCTLTIREALVNP